MDKFIDLFLNKINFKYLKYELMQLKKKHQIIIILCSIAIMFLGLLTLVYYNMLTFISIVGLLIVTYFSLIFQIKFYPKTYMTLQITNIQHEKKNNSTQTFRMLARNPTAKLITLSNIVVIWEYKHGMLCSIETPIEVPSATPITIVIEIDIDKIGYNSNSTRLVCPLKKCIDFPSESGNIMIEFEIILKLVGRLKYHPCFDWNVIFSILLEDAFGRQQVVYENELWR